MTGQGVEVEGDGRPVQPIVVEAVVNLELHLAVDVEVQSRAGHTLILVLARNVGVAGLADEVDPKADPAGCVNGTAGVDLTLDPFPAIVVARRPFQEARLGRALQDIVDRAARVAASVQEARRAEQDVDLLLVLDGDQLEG